MDDEHRTTVSKRLRSIAGHVNGIERMVAEDAYCIDVIKQVQAVQAALNKVNDLILRHEPRIVNPGAPLAGEVDCSVLHTRQLLRYPLDRCRAIGARHARYWNGYLLSRHISL